MVTCESLVLFTRVDATTRKIAIPAAVVEKLGARVEDYLLFEDTTTGIAFTCQVADLVVSGDIEEYLVKVSAELVVKTGINTGLMRVSLA